MHLEYIYKEIWLNRRVKAQADLVRGYIEFQTMKAEQKSGFNFNLLSLQRLFLFLPMFKVIFGNQIPQTCQFCLTYKLFLWHLLYTSVIAEENCLFFSQLSQSNPSEHLSSLSDKFNHYLLSSSIWKTELQLWSTSLFNCRFSKISSQTGCYIDLYS